MSKMLRLLRPHIGSIVAVLILIFLQSLANLYLPNLMSDIVNRGVLLGDTRYILRIGGFMVLVTIAGALCSVLASLFSSKVSSAFGRTLRSRVFSHVEHFSLHEFDQIGTASLITRTTNDITQVQQLINMMLRMMVMAPMMSIGGIIMAISTDAKLSLVIVFVMPALGLVIYSVLRRGMALFRAIQAKIDTLNRVLRENLIGIRVVRSFNRVSYEQNRFDRANLDLTDTAIQVNKIMAILWPAVMLIVNVSTIAIVWFGGLRISAGDMQVGSLMAFLQYVMQILFSVMMVSMMFFMIPRASASAARINEVLDREQDIVDPAVPATGTTENSQALAERGGVAEAPLVPRGEIEFDHVTFRYPGAEQPALSDISFRAKAGEVTAIIGGTGSGKSTLVNLIPRFYDIEGGRIRIDGMDVQGMTLEALRAKIGLVPQKAVLFTGSIQDNIRFGKENATDEQIRHAAEIAQATEFIEAMPEGFASTISQGGANVSGGQKQRLSIARALVRRPDIYIFDDSFSALDFKTDAKLREALKAEIVDKTVLIVAQRVSTVMDADAIVVLDEGRIVGIGTHRELLDTCTVYREIVASQLSEEEIA